jgi:transcriptional regulator with XRE-family HTH domain
MTQTRVTELRQLQGWTQEKLAESSGIGLRTIQRMEAGRDASLESISRVAAALRVPVRDLFDDLDQSVMSARVDSVESLAFEQQSARDRALRAWRLLYIGVGIVVTCVSFMVGSAGPAIFLSYWIGGTVTLIALRQLLLEPALDRRYPLSQSRTERRTGHRKESSTDPDNVDATTRADLAQNSEDARF